MLAVIRWRAAVATATYPVQLALALAILVCTVPVWLVVNQHGQVARQERALKQADVATHRLIAVIQESRRDSVALLCDQNKILIRFIRAKPDLPRDAPALRRLRAERCRRLLADVSRNLP